MWSPLKANGPEKHARRIKTHLIPLLQHHTSHVEPKIKQDTEPVTVKP